MGLSQDFWYYCHYHSQRTRDGSAEHESLGNGRVFPAPSDSRLLDDLSRASLVVGGPAWGAFQIDSPAQAAAMVRHRGLRLAVGVATEPLAEFWGIEASPFDCAAQMGALSTLRPDANGECGN